MAWDGNGNYSRIHDWTNDDGNAIDMLSARFDAEHDSIAAGINSSLQKNGENTATGNQKYGGFRLTNVGAATARTDAPQTGQVQDGAFNYGVGGGTADVITLTVVPAITAYAGGQRFVFLPSANNATTTPTLNVSAVAAKTIVKLGGAALAAGDIKINDPAVVEYNANADNLELLNPATSVQAARAINTGSGLSGGGDLSADRTLLLDINGITAETVPAIADTLAIYDDTAAASRKVTLDNFYKTINGLTEDTTPDGAADFVVTYDASASTAKKVALGNVYGLTNHIGGLLVTNGTDATHDLDIAVGSFRNAADTVSFKTTAAFGKQGDVAFAKGGTPGTPAGGLGNTVTLPASGTIHLHAITEDATGDVDFYFDTSVSGANVPTGGWTFRRRVMSWTTDGSNLLITLVTRELAGGAIEVLIDDPPLDIDAAHSATSTLRALSVPNDIQVRALINEHSTGIVLQYTHAPAASNEAPSQSVGPLYTASSVSGHGYGVPQSHLATDTSGQIRTRASAASGNVRIATLGWIDERI